MRFSTYTRLLLTTCAVALLGAFSSCKKSDDLKKVSRVYFTYKVGYSSSVKQADGSNRSECVNGDGMCDFEVRKAGLRPAGTLPEDQGFGYMTVTSGMKLKMVIYMPFMNTATYREHYADGVANIPGHWKVAVQFLTGVGLSDGYSVSMGDYKVGLGTEDRYEVLVITYG
jgi:hypothetical protein